MGRVLWQAKEQPPPQSTAAGMSALIAKLKDRKSSLDEIIVLINETSVQTADKVSRCGVV